MVWGLGYLPLEDIGVVQIRASFFVGVALKPALGLEYRVKVSRFRVQGSGFRV